MSDIIHSEIELDTGLCCKRLTQDEYVGIAKRFSELVRKFTEETGTSVVAVIMGLPSDGTNPDGIYRGSIINANTDYFPSLLRTLVGDMNRLILMLKGEAAKN
jgi:hypothetical protein